MIYGIKEDGGVPTELPGVVVQNKDDTSIRIENIIRNNSEPPIPSLEIEFVDKTNSDKVFILIKIPRSWNLPHRINMGGRTKKFYVRRGHHSEEMDIFELRTAFNLSETLAIRMKRFIEGRISTIISGETPLNLINGSKVILHLIPINAFYPGQKYEIEMATKIDSSGNRLLKLEPIYTINVDIRHNFDGILSYGQTDTEGKRESYTQLYRNGIIEAVSGNLFDIDEKIIEQSFHEVQLVKSVSDYLESYNKMNVEMPIFIFLTLLGVKGYKMRHGPGGSHRLEDYEIDRDIIIIPELMLKKYPENVGNVLKPIFDPIWNACGYPGSKNYNSENEWEPPTNTNSQSMVQMRSI